MNNNTWQNYLPLLAAFIAAAGMMIGVKMSKGAEFYSHINDNKDYAVYEALQHVEHKYYGEIDNQSFNNEIIRTVANELDDYSHYWSPIRNRRYQDYVNGSYKGRGIDIVALNDGFYISQVIPGSPAQLSGLEWGDRIIEMNGILNKSLELDTINQLFTTTDTLSIKVERHLEGDVYDIRISHGDVTLNPVTSFLLDNEMLYMKVSRFSKGVFRLFMDEFEQYDIESKKIKALVLDLRGNPGGVVEETTKILNQLVRESNLMLISTIDNKNRIKAYKSNGRGFLDIEKIAVIIDKESASASEILAGCIQDLDLGVIIGQQSYGKGEIQQNYKLSNGSSISLTVGEYLLPTGRSISKNRKDTTEYFSLKNQRTIESNQGVQPDVILNHHDNCDFNDRANWKERSFKLLKEKKLSNNGYLLDRDVNQYLEELALIVDSPCRLYIKSQILDYLLTVGLLNPDAIKDHFLSVDSSLSRAFELINDEEYHRILNN